MVGKYVMDAKVVKYFGLSKIFAIFLKKWTNSCVTLLSLFSRLSVGKIGEGIRDVKEWAILIKVLF